MKKLVLIIIILMFQRLLIYSQSSEVIDSLSQHQMGIPVSYSHQFFFNAGFKSSLPSRILPTLDNSTLKVYADSIAKNTSKGLYYYGTGIRNYIDLKNSAQYYNSSIDNGKLWILKISSSSALGFEFYFSKFNLPDGAFLHIYAADSSRILGPFNSSNNPSDTSKLIQFGTQAIMSNEVYLEYFESDSSEFTGSIIIDNIIHIFRKPFTMNTNFKNPGDPAASCQEDAACLAGWGPEINSVAKVFIYDIYSNLKGYGTGALLNNTKQDGTPYFLTAAHLLHDIGSPYDLSTWEFGFDYENLVCEPSFAGTDPFMHQLITGATLLAQDNLYSNGYPNNSDYLLLELNTTATYIQTLGVCYSGWSISPPLDGIFFSSSSQFVFIHHPNADVKKISRGDNLHASGRITPPFGQYDDYMLDINYGGALEEGSSGCPLYNYNHKIIGTSSAYIPYMNIDYDPCDNSTYAGQYFGRFDRDWTLGGFAQWLDPADLFNSSNPNYNSFYDGPSSYCPNPTAQVIEPPVSSSSSGVSLGIKINNKSGTIPTLCSTDNIDHLTITPKYANNFLVGTYSKIVKCKTVESSGPYGSYLGGCEPINIWKIKCKCYYYSFQVYISELDYNHNPTGVNATKTYEYIASTSFGSYDDIPYFSINVPAVLGYSFIPGKFYSIGIANVINGTWTYSSQIIYILPTSLAINNNPNVNSNIYAINDITINNTIVSNPVYFVASNKITINPNSYLEAGEYFIEDVDCNSFKMAVTNNNNNNNSYPLATYYPDNHFTSIIKKEEKESPSTSEIKNLTIFPNPSDGILQVFVTKNNQPIGIKEIKVYDFVGKIVWSIGESANSVFKIDLSHYSKGVYFVRCTNEQGETEVQKLIKQ